MSTYYKLARPDGWDFYSGKTINYRDAIGSVATCPNVGGAGELCSDTVLHACVNPNDCFVGARIPCSAYRVEGTPVVESAQKCGFKELRVLEEITDLDTLFGWRYTEAVNPIYPFTITPPEIGPQHIALVRVWASERANVWAGVWDSVRDSVWDSVRDSVRDSVWDYVENHVRASVWDSMWASVWASLWASAWDDAGAYIGSLFPHITEWKYMVHEPGVYPYQAGADLWRAGLLPSFYGTTWRLHGGPNGRVLWEGRP